MRLRNLRESQKSRINGNSLLLKCETKRLTSTWILRFSCSVEIANNKKRITCAPYYSGAIRHNAFWNNGCERNVAKGKHPTQWWWLHDSRQKKKWAVKRGTQDVLKSKRNNKDASWTNDIAIIDVRNDLDCEQQYPGLIDMTNTHTLACSECRSVFWRKDFPLTGCQYVMSHGVKCATGSSGNSQMKLPFCEQKHFVLLVFSPDLSFSMDFCSILTAAWTLLLFLIHLPPIPSRYLQCPPKRGGGKTVCPSTPLMPSHAKRTTTKTN